MAADGAKAASILRNWGELAHHGACLYYVWQAYAQAGAAGLANGDYQTATAGWYGSPGKHAGDRNPPAGVPVWWGPKAGSDAGDVVISLGGGRVVATDYPKYGEVGVCTIDQREAQIGRPYFGWTETILGAPINYSTASAAGEIEEEDMPLSSEDVKRVAAEVIRTFPYEDMAAHVWARNGIGDLIKRMADRVLAIYDSVRFGKKGVRTHGSLTGAIMSEIGAQQIERAQGGGDIDVQALADAIAGQVTEVQASELADAILTKTAERLKG
ncbi:hypothetical protein [Microbacterium halophytorum]|uniref:hypothetical protein n=1 Tax=Microbacterium halophytorum TaxID=2067568 RepID=UPI0018E0658A|nr:hypothetical protein [Microbacterium halophytorum]